LNAAAATLTVEGEADRDALQEEARREGYLIEPADRPGSGTVPRGDAWERRRVVLALAAVLAGYLLGWLHAHSPAAMAAFLAAVAFGGWSNFRKAIRAVPRLDFNMSVLMSAAVVGAIAIGEYEEAGIVALLFSVSEMLEGWTMERARRSIRALIEIAPKTARIERDGDLRDVAVDDVAVGEIMHVRPGEKLAMDGVILSGRSALNQAAITGESIPVEKGIGDEVFAGTLNVHGTLRIQITKRVEDTTLARIIHLVEEAQAHRAPSQAFVERFAAVYTPVVIGLAAGVAVLPPLVGGLAWGPWIYRGLALLVVSCPCALVVSTPVAIVSAISNAARRGVLIKGGAHLERLGSVTAIAFDKTGTLTTGRPMVTHVEPFDGLPEETILSDAAGVERHSEHPLAGAVLRAAAERHIPLAEATDFEATFGAGASAMLGNRLVRIGSLKMFPEATARTAARVAQLEDEGRTVLLLGDGNGPYGLVAVADEVRPGTAAVVSSLRRAGIAHVVVLTGDNARVAGSVARQVGADRFEAELLPQQKVGAISKLLDDYGAVAMVGDGVNDAPALATATVGIAMAGAGSDTALETADIALLSDDLGHLPFALNLSREALRTIRRNIAFSVGIKLVAVAAIFPGWLTLWLAILADMGASVLVTLNGIRLLRIDK
jgi:Cd2+/Zn2+-exporting ATPase